ncbi:hypothetical protein COMNV_01487 [Commensalibacter sp. Nvir]|nr:hypothetical protein COMNV_01487 [Commensalibacter sp. Nvir]
MRYDIVFNKKIINFKKLSNNFEFIFLRKKIKLVYFLISY